jgi:hypothetical protein
MSRRDIRVGIGCGAALPDFEPDASTSPINLSPARHHQRESHMLYNHCFNMQSMISSGKGERK